MPSLNRFDVRFPADPGDLRRPGRPFLGQPDTVALVALFASGKDADALMPRPAFYSFTATAPDTREERRRSRPQPLGIIRSTNHFQRASKIRSPVCPCPTYKRRNHRFGRLRIDSFGMVGNRISLGRLPVVVAIAIARLGGVITLPHWVSPTECASRGTTRRACLAQPFRLSGGPPFFRTPYELYVLHPIRTKGARDVAA